MSVCKASNAKILGCLQKIVIISISIKHLEATIFTSMFL